MTGLTGTPTFVISDQVEHIDRLLEAIYRGLTRMCSRELKVGLTDVPDGDFLGATITDHWAVTSATQTYVTLSMANGVAQRVIKVVTTAANGYTQSDAIPAEPLETRNFQVFMRNAHSTATTSNVATLVLRDLTNGATITPSFQIGSATSSSHAFVTVRGTYTVPSGCSQVAWRLGSSTDMTADSNAGVQFGMLIDNGAGQRTFTTQPHLNTEDDVLGLWIANQGGDGTSGPVDMSFTSLSMDGVSFSDMGYSYAVEFDGNPGFPIFYDEKSFYPALTSDTDTTDCPEELALTAAAVQLYRTIKYGSNAAPQLSRGKIVPTATMLKLEEALAQWNSNRVSRLRSGSRRSIRRTSALGTYA